jgi:hypothetical protein
MAADDKNRTKKNGQIYDSLQLNVVKAKIDIK